MLLEAEALSGENGTLNFDRASLGDLPVRLEGALTKIGPQSSDTSYLITLNKNEVQAIEEALAQFKTLRLHGQEVCKDNFKLPDELCKKLATGAWEVHNGSGLCLIHGLVATDYSDADNLIIYLALGSHIGDKRGIQDKKGNVISHITDAKLWTTPYEKRHVVHTNKALTWHCDMGADILALQVRQVAMAGGQTMVASAWSVYNDLAAKHPDVIRVLAEPNWPVHVSDRTSRYVLAPLLAFHDGKLLVNFDPSRLGAHPAMERKRSRLPAIPALTDAQRKALSVVNSVAQEIGVELKTVPGDLVFINNWALLHARTAYIDAGSSIADDKGDNAISDEPNVSQRRHLLRLWLRNSELGWNIPESLRVPWEAAFGYSDEGYISADHSFTTAAKMRYAVTPEPDYKPAQYTSGSAAFVLDDSDSEISEEYEG